MKVIKNNVITNIHYYLKIDTETEKWFSTCIDETKGTIGLMNVPGKLSQEVNAQDSRATIGKIKIRINNKNCQVSKFVYENLEKEYKNLFEAKAEIYVKENENELVLLYTAFISGINPDVFETYFDIELKDIKEKFKKSLFEKKLADYAFSENLPEPTDFNFLYDNTNKKLTYEGHPIDFTLDIIKCLFGNEDYINYIVPESFDKSLYNPDLNFYFEFKEPLEKPLEFLEKQVFQALNVYHAVMSDGRLKLIKQKQPSKDDFENYEDTILSENDIISVDSNKINLDNIVNHCYIKSNYNFTEDDFLEADYYVSPSSYRKYGLKPDKAKSLEFKGLNNMEDTEKRTFLQSIGNKYFDRYAHNKKEIQLSVFFSKNSFEIGNYIILEHSKLVNWEQNEENIAGDRGITANDARGEAYAKIMPSGSVYGSEWADYLGEENNDYIGYLNSKQVTDVDRVINADLFESIIKNHDTLANYLLNEYSDYENYNITDPIGETEIEFNFYIYCTDGRT